MILRSELLTVNVNTFKEILFFFTSEEIFNQNVIEEITKKAFKDLILSFVQQTQPFLLFLHNFSDQSINQESHLKK